MLIYRYIISNAEKVPYMTIRELAGEIHTSPGAILRFCSKNSFQGYAELKEALRRQNQTLQSSLPSSDLQELSAFFERAGRAFARKKHWFRLPDDADSRCQLFLKGTAIGTLKKGGKLLQIG